MMKAVALVAWLLASCCYQLTTAQQSDSEHFEFVQLGATSGVDSITVPTNDDGTSSPIPISNGFLLGQSTQIVVYVVTNGFFSFGRPVTDFSPSLFPNEHTYLVAPFWADADISQGNGEILYEIHNVSGDPVIANTNNFINQQQGTDFLGQWLLVAEWREVPPFPGTSSATTNSFQGILITDGSQSYSVFTYRCGGMQWSGGATIGYNTDGSFYFNHPLSGTSNANSIACVNSPATVWSNLVYQLNQPPVTVAPLPTGTPLPIPDHILFVELGSTQGVATITVPANDDGTSNAIIISEGFIFGESTQIVVYVVTNGFFSFGRPITDFSPTLFPTEHAFLVAPFWADADISFGNGEILYEIHNVSGDPVIADVSDFISEQEDIDFLGQWLLVAEWKEVPPFPGTSSVTTNSFQGILITDGSRSYTMFTYRCGGMQWSGGATIGFYASGDFYQNHPLSGSSSANSIACVNSPATVWSNLVYQLTAPVNPTVTPVPMPTSVPVPEHIEFVQLGATSGVDIITVPANDDGTSSPIPISNGFLLGQSSQTVVYVVTNGFFSFGRPITDFSPSLFPNEDTYLVAPFWADADISQGNGEILYEIHTASGDPVIAEVSDFISEQEDIDFLGQWLLVAEWKEVPPFPGSSNAVTNTFQGVLVTDGTRTYTLFTYNCRLMQWSGGATIGFNSDGSFFQNHPLSGTSHANSVACLNFPPTDWSNLVYQLNQAPVTATLLPTATPLPVPEHLAFLELGTTAGVSPVFLPRSNNGNSNQIPIQGGFPFGGTNQTVVYVITNGLFSFEQAVIDPSPSLFPLEYNYLVAPFWANTDISNGLGEILYEVHTGNSDPLISQASNFISVQTDFEFQGQWLLVAEWKEVPPSPGASDSSLNSFQGILITDGSCSYTLFTYRCGGMQWSGGATIGFYASGDFYQNHPLSGSSIANSIACVNSPATIWSNLVYQLNQPSATQSTAVVPVPSTPQPTIFTSPGIPHISPGSNTSQPEPTATTTESTTTATTSAFTGTAEIPTLATSTSSTAETPEVELPQGRVSGGLSGGAIGGIVFAVIVCVVVIILLAAVAILLYWRKHRQNYKMGELFDEATRNVNLSLHDVSLLDKQDQATADGELSGETLGKKLDEGKVVATDEDVFDDDKKHLIDVTVENECTEL